MVMLQPQICRGKLPLCPDSGFGIVQVTFAHLKMYAHLLSHQPCVCGLKSLLMFEKVVECKHSFSNNMIFGILQCCPCVSIPRCCIEYRHAVLNSYLCVHKLAENRYGVTHFLAYFTLKGAHVSDELSTIFVS